MAVSYDSAWRILHMHMHMQSPTTYYHKSQWSPCSRFYCRAHCTTWSCAGCGRLGTADSMWSGNIIRCGIRLRTKRCKKGLWMLQGIEPSYHLEDPYSFSCELRILAAIASHYRMQMYWRFKSSCQSWSQNHYLQGALALPPVLFCSITPLITNGKIAAYRGPICNVQSNSWFWRWQDGSNLYTATLIHKKRHKIIGCELESMAVGCRQIIIFQIHLSTRTITLPASLPPVEGIRNPVMSPLQCNIHSYSSWMCHQSLGMKTARLVRPKAPPSPSIGREI